jgi:hypothetical protein
MNLRFSVIALALTLFAASCSKQPTACINASKTTVDIGEDITFTSCSENAESVSWDFGDGRTAEGTTVTQSYDKPGTYIVQVKALSKDKKKIDRFSVVVTVRGYTRYITKVVLKGYAATKPDGSNWDNVSAIPGPGQGVDPDVFVRFNIAADDWTFNTTPKNDIKPADLPHTWNLTQENIYLSNKTWSIQIRDNDVIGTTFLSELMTEWTINPATAGGNGVIKLTATGGYELEIYYENRQ